MTTAKATARHRRIEPDDILQGLFAASKHLPCRLLYDAAGADLFEQISRIEAYYPTRTELALLRDQLPAIAAAVGPRARVIEPGSGEGIKTTLLLDALESPAVYVPIDVADEQLQRAATTLRGSHPSLEVTPLVADYTTRFTLPTAASAFEASLVFFPGSTIGNFEPDEATAFLKQLGQLAGGGAKLLLGADGTRDEARLVRAYDDDEGVTAAFDKNVLAHLNRTRGATFDLDTFEHRAIWNREASRVEMHLVSTKEQLVRIDTSVIAFAAGEPIVTEHCYKHAPAALQAILANAGWRTQQVFTANDVPYRLWLCEAE